ncbi:MAG: hypothetical protein PWQ42_301 [Sulfurospirillum sp.]|jgi:hypothetical protein|nr:hypothetical protein [Sulfurospirillum sp.]DAB34656.1 MAG TPA: hypothetical protein CFH82_04200 [Sulfurospirillum sp. UBA12182]
MIKIFRKILDFYRYKLSYQQESKNIEKLTKWAVLFVIILDIFVYSAINMGIEFQTATLNNPSTKFTYQCRNIIEDVERVKDYNWYQYKTTPQNQNNQNYIYQNGTTQASKNLIKEIKSKELDTRCANIKTQIENISNSNELQNIKKSIKALEKEKTKFQGDINYIQNNYNTVLFEKIANQQESHSILEMDLETKNIKAKYDTLKKNIASHEKSISLLKSEFQNHTFVLALEQYIKEHKRDILEDYKRENSRYFLKRSGIIIGFLLPLITLFYWQMGVQNAKRNYTKYIIFKNVFVISMIFFLINLISIIYNFIPHVFIQKVLMFFYTLQIPFVAYYVLLFLGIVLFSFIILKIQNFNKNKKKTTITFIESYRANKCDKCGIKVDYHSMNFCPNCANTLKISCPNCQHYTIKGFEFCSHCKSQISQNEN